ncbi:MAG: hypothetical protein KGJ13_02365 [Patescibacteria group bacterium]|nr:hypothetical protein [Patescibacteria group bacterium]
MSGRRIRAALIAAPAIISLAAASIRAQNYALTSDFTNISQWLSQNIARGLAFNAGETFDPPKEVKDRRLQPDISFGAGFLPLDTAKFPATPAMTGENINAASFFPSHVLFPNFVMHLRAGLPGRCDFALRAADMTTPPGYKLSSSLSGQGQSNSLGMDLRKHFLGVDGEPMITVSANYNYVFGRFNFKETLPVSVLNGAIELNNNLAGNLRWSVASYGLNAIISRQIGRWTPFIGLGYNHAAGSVSSSLSDTGDVNEFTPVVGQAAAKTTPDQARGLLGWQWTRSWIDYFAEGEIEAVGPESGKVWIAQAGLSLPFYIGLKRKNKDAQGVLRDGPAAPLSPDSSQPVFMR